MANKKVSKRISKRRKRRILILGTISIFLFACFCFNLVNYSYKIISLSNQEKKLKQELIDLKEKKAILDSELEKLQDPEYLAKFAREKYSYSKQDEYVIKTIETKEDEIKEIEQETIKYKYVIAGSVVFIMLIFIIMRRR